MLCSKCGKELSDGVAFCPSCGTPVEKIAFCGKCGARIAPGENFCPSCGMPIAQAAPSLNVERKQETTAEASPETYHFLHWRHFARVQYLRISTDVAVRDDSLQVLRRDTWLLFWNRPEVQYTIPFESIQKVSYVSTWAIGGLVSAAFLAVCSIAFAMYYGFLFVALMIWLAHDKAVVLQMRDGKKHSIYGEFYKTGFFSDFQQKMSDKGYGNAIDETFAKQVSSLNEELYRRKSP